MTEIDVIKFIGVLVSAMVPSLIAVYHLGNRMTRIETKLNLFFSLCPNMNKHTTADREMCSYD